MTAVIYARYSSDSQREASIEGQLRDCKDYAEKNGITVVGTYIDRAYSAKTDDRPDFQRMIKDSGKKIFDVVLVWKLDRFARNRFDAVNYKYQLEKNGVHLVSAMEPISQGPEGIMVESMLIGMAEYYSAELALKVARGERENALQCKYNGGVVPLGFTIGKEDRLYHIDPETAPIVQEIFTRYADGEPAEKIAASLNERGLRTRTGKPFVKNSFFQIFRNRRYIGEYRYKDIVTPGGIPAIVDQDLFDRVQQRFEQNRIAHGRPAKEDVSYLLTTKLFCGKCGTLMGGESGTSHMGNTYYYYKCGNAKRHGKAHCDLKAIRKEPLERFVVDTAIKVIFSDEIIERLIDLVMEAQQKENTRLPVLKDQLRDTEKRLANLLEAIEQGILTPTTKQRLDELEARKEALNTSILEEELKKPVLTREWMRFWFEKFRKGDMRDMEHQRQIIDTFVNSVYVFDDRVVLNFNFTDDSKTISREEVLGSSAVENAPPKQEPLTSVRGFFAASSTRPCWNGTKYPRQTIAHAAAACRGTYFSVILCGDAPKIQHHHRICLHSIDDSIRCRKAFQRVLPHLNADVSDPAVGCGGKLALGSRGDLQPVTGGKGNSRAIDHSGAFSLKDSINFLVVLMRMHERHPCTGRQSVDAHLCTGQRQLVVQLCAVFVSNIDLCIVCHGRNPPICFASFLAVCSLHGCNCADKYAPFYNCTYKTECAILIKRGDIR